MGSVITFLMATNKIAVIGSGEMGHGIAEVAALNGYDVVMRDIKEEIVQNGYENIEWSLNKLADKKQIEQEPADVLERIETTVDLEDAVSDVDAVIEAVPENLGLKRDVFAELDEFAPEHATLATNTSGIPITKIAEVTNTPERVVGLHFFNPVLMMDFIEIIRGEETSDEAVDVAIDLADGFDKEYVVLQKDPPGFITSRVISRYFMEGVWQYEEGNGTIEEIDAACKFGTGFPMGPFELMDQTGLDLVEQEDSDTEEGDWSGSAETPPSLLELIEEGHHGKKTGKGWYDYEDGDGVTSSPDQTDAFDPLPVIAATVNEAARLIDWDVADPEAIDRAMRLGTAYPKGPCRLGDELGLDTVLESIEDNDRWPTSELLAEMVEEGTTGEEAGEGFYSYEQEAEADVYGDIQFDHDEETGIATITLDRPMRQNALSQQMLEEFDEVAEKIRSATDEYRCLILRGADGNFCAGGDISMFSGITPHETMNRTDPMTKIEELPIPTVAAVEGNCLGGGLEVACACDFRIAKEDATLGNVEIDLGLIPGGGGTQRLPRLVGLAKAKELVMLGKRLSAEEAKDIHLVTEVAAEDEFEERVEAFVDELASGPPVAQKVSKYLLHDAVDAPLQAGLTSEQMAFAMLLETDDVMAGIEAFFGDDDPDFQGK